MGAEAQLRPLRKQAEAIEQLEPTYIAMSDDDLRAQTALFKERYQKGESLDDLLPEAFAVVREASKRTLGLRPFTVQLIGGIVLHQGRIAEMKTGEGKTLTACLPAYLKVLSNQVRNFELRLPCHAACLSSDLSESSLRYPLVTDQSSEYSIRYTVTSRR